MKSPSLLIVLTIFSTFLYVAVAFKLNNRLAALPRIWKKPSELQSSHDVNYQRMVSLKSSKAPSSVAMAAGGPFSNVANILTLARVVAIPFFMLSFVLGKV